MNNKEIKLLCYLLNSVQRAGNEQLGQLHQSSFTI